MPLTRTASGQATVGRRVLRRWKDAGWMIDRSRGEGRRYRAGESGDESGVTPVDLRCPHDLEFLSLEVPGHSRSGAVDLIPERGLYLILLILRGHFETGLPVAGAGEASGHGHDHG